MRVVPPREMLEYLDSIGVRPSISASPMKSNPPVVAKKPSGGDGGKGNSGCLLFFLIPGLAAAFGALLKALTIILVGVGLIASSAQSSAQNSSGNPAAIDQPQPSDSAAEQEELLIFPILDDAVFSGELATKGDDSQDEAVGSQAEDVTPGVVSTSDESAKITSPPVKGQPEAKSVEDAWILDADAKLSEELNNLQDAVHADVPRGESHTLSAPIELWPGQNDGQVRALRPSWDTRISRGYPNSAHSNDDFTSTLLVVGCAGLIFFMGFYIYTERALNRQVAQTYVRDRVLVRKPLFPEQSNQTVMAERPLSVHKSNSMPVPRYWRLGLHSTKGNVRSENQDFGRVFELNDYQVLLIGDGCGGVPFGADASRIAVETCCTEIFRQLVNDGVSVDLAIERGFAAASDALVSRGIELAITTLESGLRTTLIVAIGTSSQFYWGYIGDGALRIISSIGQQFECMVAHRSNPMVTNVLAASLGPTIHGKPCFGSKKRERGDVLLAGTDGVFDRVDDRFSRELMRMAIFYKGDLMQATRESVEQLAQVVDANSRSFVCDDNLTLGLMMDGNRPDFLPEFWKTPNLSHSFEGAHHD